MDMQSSIVSVRSEQQAIDAVKIIANIVSTLRHDVLKPDMDYGVIPGTGSKPTLLLPGMEKLMRALNAVPEYIERCVIRDYDKPLFHYEYECRLVDADTGLSIPGGRGLGMCTSHESAFRWRRAERTCPTCGKQTIFKSKDKPEWYCWKKKDGCGAIFPESDQRITSQVVGRIENPDIFDQVNAILKRAKKRALGDAVKGAANVSEFFTVDLEDMVYHDDIIVEGTATHVALPATTTEQPTEKTPKPQSPPTAQSQPPPEKTAEQIEAERKAEENKQAAQRLGVLVSGMEQNGISLSTALQTLNIAEADKYNFELWKTHGATPKAIADKVASILTANDKPAAPKGNPFGGAADKRHNWTTDEIMAMDALCATFYDVEFEAPLLVDRFLADTERVAWSSDFPTGPDAARAALMEYATDNQLPLIVGMATHTANHKATTFTNGLMLVTEYSRDRLRNLGEDWKTYVDGWSSAGGKYQFDRKGLPNLIISWESKNHESDGHEYKVCTEIDVLEPA